MNDVTAAALIGMFSAFTGSLLVAIGAAWKVWIEYRKAVELAKLHADDARRERREVADKVEQVRLAAKTAALRSIDASNQITEIGKTLDLTHEAVNGGVKKMRDEIAELKCRVAALGGEPDVAKEHKQPPPESPT